MVVRINITMPEEFLRAVDETARAEHRGRSELIREALRSYMYPVSPDKATAKHRRAAACVREAGSSKGSGGAEPRELEEPGKRKGRDIAGVLRRFFAREEDVSLAYIFGSRATGRSGPLSDIDVAVLLDEATDPGEYSGRRMEMAAALEDHLGERRVDVLILNAAPPGMQFQAIKEGKTVYRREEDLPPVFESGVIMRYLDFARIEEDYMRGLADRIARGEMLDQ